MKFLMGLLIVLFAIGFSVAPAVACSHVAHCASGSCDIGGHHSHVGDTANNDSDDNDGGDSGHTHHGHCSGGTCHI